MANIHIGTDNIGSYSHDINNLNTVIEKLRAAGHTVTSAGRGDNAIQGHMLSKSNECDIMMQIAGGQCPGSFCDFHWGTRPNGYYHAKKFCIPIETSVWTQYSKYNPKKYKLPASAWDDGFSGGLDKSKVVGRTWKEISEDKTNHPRCIGFVEGNGGEEVGNNLVKLLNGGSSTTDSQNQQAGGGGSIIDYIKQVCSDLDPYGVELDLEGDTLHVHKSRVSSAKLLDESRIVTNSVSYTDYNSNTPNSNKTAKDKYLINRFGEIPLEATVEGDEAQVLQIAQRTGGHSLDLKCILSKDYQAGEWVNLNIPSLNIENRKYFISKLSYDEELTTTITLERGPPSLYVEVMDVAEETTEEGTTEEDGEDSEDGG